MFSFFIFLWDAYRFKTNRGAAHENDILISLDEGVKKA